MVVADTLGGMNGGVNLSLQHSCVLKYRYKYMDFKPLSKSTNTEKSTKVTVRGASVVCYFIPVYTQIPTQRSQGNDLHGYSINNSP